MEKVLFFLALIWGVHCIQKCTKEGQISQVAGRCSYYKKCTNGTFNLEKCGFGKKFNSTIGTCEWYWKVNCEDWAPECEDGLLYRHPDSCRAYYSCSESRLKTEFCPFLFGFNGEKCSFMVSCPKSECTTGTIKAADCSNYDLCQNGKWIRKTCGLGQSFNPETKRCKYGGCSQCEHGTTELVDGYCHKYKECKNGLFEEKTCGLGQMYNVTIGSCDWFYKVDCSPMNKMCSGDYSFCGDVNCKKFYTCTNSQFKMDTCGPLRKFDLTQNKCVFTFLSFAEQEKQEKQQQQQKQQEKQPQQQEKQQQQQQQQQPQQQLNNNTSCLEGKLYPIEKDPYSYFRCSNGEKVKESCWRFWNRKYFNKESEQCESYCSEGDLKANQDCTKFDQCINGMWTVKKCMDNAGFDAKNRMCVYGSDESGCDKIKCLEGTRYPIEEDHTTYLQCQNGEKIKMKCPDDAKYFDIDEYKCVPPCKELTLKPDNEDCTNYKECLNGDYKKMSCKADKGFDNIFKRCVQKPRCANNLCLNDQLQPIKDNCYDYYKCNNGTKMVESCWSIFNWKYFNPKTLKCEFTLYSKDCSSLWCKEGDVRATNNSKIYEQCTKDGDWVKKSCFEGFDAEKNICPESSRNKRDIGQFEEINFARECIENSLKPNQDCSKFDKCKNGVWNTTSCPKYQIFDAQSKMCLFQDEAECSESSCLEGELYRIKTDCYSYYQCTNGQKVKKSCGTFHYFNPDTKKCTFSLMTQDCSQFLCKNGEQQPTNNKFIYKKCINGDWIKTECIRGYDADKNECPTSSFNKKCKNGSKIQGSNLNEYKECTNGIWTIKKCLIESEIWDQNGQKCIKSRSKREVCKIGEKKMMEGYCSMYKQCTKNGWEIRYCSSNQVFNNGKCINNGICPTYEPIQYQCDAFMYNNQMYNCNPGDKFDYIKKQCVDYALGHCLDQECIDGTKKNHETDCSMYYQCTNSNFELKKCNLWQNFDSKTQKCVFYGAQCKYEIEICINGSQRKTDCSHYEICKGDHFEQKKCWFFQKYDSKQQQCTMFWNIKCSDNTQLFTNNEQCIENDKILIENTCRYYKQCINGAWNVQKCSPCMNFNTDIKDCDYVWRNPCSSDTTDPTGMTTDPPITTSPPPTTSKPEKCHNGDIKGDSGSCVIYHICQNNIWNDQKCSFWQRFDSVSKSCVFYTSATCTQ